MIKPKQLAKPIIPNFQNSDCWDDTLISESHRFGFNGKGKVEEISNVTCVDLEFGARINDSWVGRWLRLDPF